MKLTLLRSLQLPAVLLDLIKSFLFYDRALFLTRQTLRGIAKYLANSPRYVYVKEKSCIWFIYISSKIIRNENCLKCGNFILDPVSHLLILRRPKALSH